MGQAAVLTASPCTGASLSPQCWPQAPLTDLQQPLLWGKSCREPGRWIDGEERGLGAVPQHRQSVHGVLVCLPQGFVAQGDITVMPRESGAAMATSELPEAQPCPLDKLDLRARSPPCPQNPLLFPRSPPASGASSSALWQRGHQTFIPCSPRSMTEPFCHQLRRRRRQELPGAHS